MTRLLSFVRHHPDISISIVFLIVSIIFMTMPSSFKLDYIKKFNRIILSPVQWGTTYLTSLHDMEEEIASLRVDNSRLALELSRSEDLIMENRRLRRLLEFSHRRGVKFLPSRVISISLNEPLNSILIDKGSNDGVTVYSPVMTADGLVGKILEVDSRTSLAQLFSHPQFRAAAVVPARGEMGILKSTGSKLLLTGLSMNTEIIEGDRVVTSGLGGVYPEGIPIGYVTLITEDEIGIEKVAKVFPYVSISGIFEVTILLDEAYVDPDTTVLRRARGSLIPLWETSGGEGGE
jgi:rod shape-determining protein MreC